VDQPATGMFRSPWAKITGVMVLILVGALLGKFIGGGGDTGAGNSREAPIRLSVLLPESARLAFGEAPIGYESAMLTLSPDGRWLVYVGKDGNDTRLYRKDLFSFADPEPIAGTEGAVAPSFSPGGEDVAFLTWTKLVRVGLDGERRQVLADASTSTMVTWAENGYVYYAQEEAKQLFRAPENGGESEALLELHDGLFSQVLPDGKGALVTVRQGGIGADGFNVALLDLASKEQTELIRGGYAGLYAGAGQLVFCRAGALMAVPFDPGRGTVTGEPVTLEPGAAMDSLFSKGQVAFSSSGLMAYVPGGDKALGRIAWIEEDGRSGLLDLPPRIYGKFDLDDNDRRLAIHVGDLTDSILVYDLERRDEIPLAGSEGKGWPRWSYGGDAIAFSRLGTGNQMALAVYDLKSRSAEELGDYFPEAWFPGDREILARNSDGTIVAVPLDGGEVTVTGRSGDLVELSPDGRWVSCAIAGGGATEVVAWSWPDGAVEHRIGDGIEVRWIRNGDLFYRKGGNWFKVETTLEPEFSFRPAVPSFQVQFLDTPGPSYDVTSDGSRMYYVKQAVPSIDDRIRIVPGWAD
jgi:hypothetical protein